LSNANALRRRNVILVLKTILHQPGITQPQIAAACGLTLPTVNKCVRELGETGAVVELQETRSSGGRPASLYRFNPQVGCIIGVQMDLQRLTVGIFDFELTCLDSRSIAFDLQNCGVEECVQALLEQLTAVINQIAERRLRCYGIGVSVPGPVDVKSGMVYRLPHALRWRGVPLGAMLQERFGLPVYVEKDNNAAVLSLKWLEKFGEDQSAVFVGTQRGLGAGLLINGQVFHGALAVAGEIGHVSIDQNGALCNCKNRGCLELYASQEAAVRNMQQRMGDPSITIDDLVAAAQAGEELALEVLQENTGYLQICIDYLIKMYAPQQIIIDSPWLSRVPGLFCRMLASVFEKTALITREDIKITLNSHQDLPLRGAAALVMDSHLYNAATSVFVK